MPTFAQLMAMVGRSIQSPREGAAEVLSFGVPREALWLIVATVVALSCISTEIKVLLTALDGLPEPIAAIVGNPAAFAALQFVGLVVTIAAVYAIGRAMGGTGSLEETALVICWLQFILVCLDVAWIGAFVLNPLLSNLVGLATMVLSLWLLTNFIAALHGFRSLLQVFGMILVSTFTLLVVLSLALVLAGFGAGPSGEV